MIPVLVPGACIAAGVDHDALKFCWFHYIYKRKSLRESKIIRLNSKRKKRQSCNIGQQSLNFHVYSYDACDDFEREMLSNHSCCSSFNHLDYKNCLRLSQLDAQLGCISMAKLTLLLVRMLQILQLLPKRWRESGQLLLQCLILLSQLSVPLSRLMSGQVCFLDALFLCAC